ncbi:hypothetical protein FRC14_006957 [Serendipita sp. 396]|nr:hypothetical protein FRC14_006957 [Serendipita sp. 396]KAG8788420.1 hypothetical protein FRC15_004395 [Serendipita sp. 397]KAG8839354.1 hypothetical protein FRC18_011465 [Serendipita sp. 400]KAG8840625.1 hypothetical protein FRC20_005517 [Serendipita sp. 405]
MASSSLKSDLVVQFVASTASVSKQDARNKAQAALDEYNELLNTLHNAGLLAAGKPGNTTGEILVVVSCPWDKLRELIETERHTDFLHGLLTNAYSGEDRDFSAAPVSPADRLRLVHSYVTATNTQGGLGIAPGSKKWPHVKSVFVLHDRTFNHTWISSWTKRQLGFSLSDKELDVVKNQFGESVALYYTFLSSYAQSLVFPALIGVTFWKFEKPYNPIYSFLVVIWSVTFVEWWRIRERKLSIRWGTRGAAKVEKRRVEFRPVKETVDEDDESFPWWKREFRVLTSLPVIATAAVILTALLTGIFVLEAFVTQLYTGPGHQVASLIPTIMFAALVPQFLGVYQKIAAALTEWENHAHQSTHDASLTIKTFALSSIVAYLGLSLSAFVYVPFGEYLMTLVHALLFKESAKPADNKADAKVHEGAAKLTPASAETASNIASKLNSSRLQNQMFAYTVTNQIINTFLEIGLPFVMRGVGNVRSGKGLRMSGTPKAEKDDPTGDKLFIHDVQYQASLPEYSIFVDYSEMVTQFGYVALYSTIWPLAPVMALVNDWLELRSDAFKMTTHTRRPIPTRVDTIGPWLENLGFITWLAALINSALVYLFRPSTTRGFLSSIFHQHAMSAHSGPLDTLETSIVPALLIALSASHGYIVLRAAIRHLLERALWKGCPESREGERKERIVKQTYLKSAKAAGASSVQSQKREPSTVSNSLLWQEDGKAELEKWIKTE